MMIPPKDAVNSGAVIVDIRTEKEHENLRLTCPHTHIPFENIDLRDFIETRKNEPLCILCHSGGRAAKFAEILIKSGMTQVKVVEGGLRSCCETGIGTEGDGTLPEEEIQAAAKESVQKFIEKNTG